MRHENNETNDPPSHPWGTPPIMPGEIPGVTDERGRKNPPVPLVHALRTRSVWVVIIALVAVIAGLQGVDRYLGDDQEVAPASPQSVGAMQLRMISRYTIGAVELEQTLARLAPQPAGGSATARMVSQLDEIAGENPVQQIRAAGVTHFLQPMSRQPALSLLERAESFIDAVPEGKGQRERWSELGYREDIAAMRRLIKDGPAALSDDERGRLVERYDDFARAALVALLSEGTPERDSVIAKGVRTLVTLLSLVALLAIALLAGLALFVLGCVLLGTGRLRARFMESLADKLADKEVSAAPPPAGLTLEVFALFLGGFLAVQLLAGLLVMPVATWLGLPDSHRMVVLLPMLWALLSLALWPVWMGMRGRWNARALGWHRGRGIVREIGAGFVGYLAGLPIVLIGILGTLLIGMLMERLGLSGDGSHPAPDLIAGADGLIPLLALICLGVVWAPVVEETFFRGALHHHLRRSHGFVFTGLLSGFLFAAIHPQGIVGVPALTAMGFVFAMLREWRGSLIAPIISHALNNGVIFTMLILALG